eukprot:gene9922-10939_t
MFIFGLLLAILFVASSPTTDSSGNLKDENKQTCTESNGRICNNDVEKLRKDVAENTALLKKMVSEFELDNNADNKMAPTATTSDMKAWNDNGKALENELTIQKDSTAVTEEDNPKSNFDDVEYLFDGDVGSFQDPEVMKENEDSEESVLVSAESVLFSAESVLVSAEDAVQLQPVKQLSRKGCDDVFLTNMVAACRASYGGGFWSRSVQLFSCTGSAASYYNAARVGGGPRYGPNGRR